MRARKHRRGDPPRGFLYAVPTADEVAAYQAKHRHAPSVYRLICEACHARIWGSGLGTGSHRRRCPGRALCSPPCDLCVKQAVAALKAEIESPAFARAVGLAPLTCSACGETYREAEHTIADVDPGLCPRCAVGG